MKSATITLENSNLRIVLDKDPGAVVHIGCVQTGWSVLDGKSLAYRFNSSFLPGRLKTGIPRDGET